jgi:hypothetical protein
VTHCDQLLQVLSDGRPHDHRQLYALGMVVHSRVNDLRSKGHTILCWREGDTSFYQYVSELTERVTVANPGVAAVRSSGWTSTRSVSSSDQLAGTGSETRRPLGSTTVRVDTATPLFDGVPVPVEIVGQLRLGDDRYAVVGSGEAA